MLASLPPAGRERGAGLLFRHRRSWPRRSFAAHLWRADRADRRLCRREPCSARGHDARPARRLVSRLGRRRDLPPRRHLDGLPAGPALDPAGRRARRRRRIGHRGDRHHRLDALLPRRARRDDGASPSRICHRGPRHRLSAVPYPYARNPAQRGAGAAGAGQPRNGHRRHRRGDPVVRRPLGVVGYADLGRHDRRGPAFIHQTWWVFAAPLAALFATVLAFNQLGDGLRRALDPVLQR